MSQQQFSEQELLARISELETELKQIKKQKKYGLVWENHTEDVVLQCQNNVPILKEVKSRKIVDKDNTKPTNILIEGDNYHALSVLNYTHRGKVDVIYIDPPYNTGEDGFRYKDARFTKEFPDGTLVPKDHPLRHSYWLSFMEKRLKLAKSILSEKGVIFISIDDNEFAQLKLLSDEVFGYNNSVGPIIWHKKTQPSFLTKEIISVTEYILCYKGSNNIIPMKGGFTDPDKHIELLNKPNQIQLRYFKQNIEIGSKYTGTLLKGLYGNGDLKVEILEDVKVIEGEPQGELKIMGRFKWSQERIDQALEDGAKIFFKSTKTMRATLKLCNNLEKIKPPINIFSKYINNAPTNTDATNELKNMFNDISPMDYPKPTKLIQSLIDSVIYDRDTPIILDFFAGSGTTGHAVMELNKQDGGNRQFILCTNNENNICEEVTYERLKRVMKGYKNKKGETVEGLGGNLEYFKCELIDKVKHTDNMKLRMVRACTEMLCLKESTFNLEKEVKDGDVLMYRIYSGTGIDESGNTTKKYTGIYYDLDESYLEHMRTELSAYNQGIQHAYIFSLRNMDNITSDYKKWRGISIEEIPQKILEIYESIYKQTGRNA